MTRHPQARRALPWLGLFLCVAMAACSQDHDVFLVIDWTTVGAPESLEIGILDERTCVSQADFVEQARTADNFMYHFEGAWSDRAEAPPVGRLRDHAFAFIVLLRDDECAVQGYGCAVATPSEGSVIALHADFPEAPQACEGACDALVCDET